MYRIILFFSEIKIYKQKLSYMLNVKIQFEMSEFHIVCAGARNSRRIFHFLFARVEFLEQRRVRLLATTARERLRENNERFRSRLRSGLSIIVTRFDRQGAAGNGWQRLAILLTRRESLPPSRARVPNGLGRYERFALSLPRPANASQSRRAVG